MPLDADERRPRMKTIFDDLFPRMSYGEATFVKMDRRWLGIVSSPYGHYTS